MQSEFFPCIIFLDIYDQVKENGLEDSVMTVEEIRSGIESRGTGTPSFSGLDICYFISLNVDEDLILSLHE